MSRYDPYDGYGALCEITEPFLGSMTKDMMTTGWDYKLLFPMLELRCKMQVITKIGLDREAVGEHYEFRPLLGPTCSRRGSDIPQVALNLHRHRVRAAEHAPEGR